VVDRVVSVGNGLYKVHLVTRDGRGHWLQVSRGVGNVMGVTLAASAYAILYEAGGVGP
jgi:hypothetical protein